MRYYECNGYGIGSIKNYKRKEWFDIYEGIKQ